MDLIRDGKINGLMELGMDRQKDEINDGGMDGCTAFKSLYQLHLIAYCDKMGNLRFSRILKDGLL